MMEMNLMTHSDHRMSVQALIHPLTPFNGTPPWNRGDSRALWTVYNPFLDIQKILAERAELDRDSFGVHVTSLREQVQSLETAIVAERSTVADPKDDLRIASERRDAFAATANAKDQEINGLRRQIEEYVTLKGKLRDDISGLESALYETRAKFSIT
ncbi:hypothetical protein BDM02DRAFT_2755432 [Thelephora ganbajun]|uniref:Uncharacterized protein n=1 Tax=Thelephora ganbajun TaxID=370292 RepID=A0ACB6ZS66_THEGA|nr:hypothetical protein BDM02DRAFT_2755432 [Thelephora ganbajun]